VVLSVPSAKPNGAKLFRKPVAVLVGPRTFSAAEDFTAAFRNMRRGPIVAEPTGGSTGQPLFFDLPGGGAARVCTKRDTFPDGREFVGGSSPTSWCARRWPMCGLGATRCSRRRCGR